VDDFNKREATCIYKYISLIDVNEAGYLSILTLLISVDFPSVTRFIINGFSWLLLCSKTS